MSNLWTHCNFGWPFEPLCIVITLTLNSELAALFFLSRVSHKGEFYLEMFLMRQHCTLAYFDIFLLSLDLCCAACLHVIVALCFVTCDLYCTVN